VSLKAVCFQYVIEIPKRSAGSCAVLVFKTGLPEDKWRGVVINGDMFFWAVGRLKTFFDLGAAKTCEQTGQDKIDKSIQQPQ